MYQSDVVLDLDVQSRGQRSLYGHSFMFVGGFEACLAGQDGDDEQIAAKCARSKLMMVKCSESRINTGSMTASARFQCCKHICTFSRRLCFSSLFSPISSLCFHYDLS
jgi:hypothetical protein